MTKHTKCKSYRSNQDWTTIFKLVGYLCICKHWSATVSTECVFIPKTQNNGVKLRFSLQLNEPVRCSASDMRFFCEQRMGKDFDNQSAALTFAKIYSLSKKNEITGSHALFMHDLFPWMNSGYRPQHWRALLCVVLTLFFIIGFHRDKSISPVNSLTEVIHWCLNVKSELVSAVWLVLF